MRVFLSPNLRNEQPAGCHPLAKPNRFSAAKGADLVIDALIFDFDGLIIDTESADYQSWQELFAEFDAELPLSMWVEYVGSAEVFDPFSYLEAQTGSAVDRATLSVQRQQRNLDLVGQMTVKPGVVDTLHAARDAGLRLAVASSSPHAWVDPLLTRLELTDWFEIVACRDDVGNVGKPHPDVYQFAMRHIDVGVGQAMALEDSPHGVAAAKAAGLYCVAIPGPITRWLNFDHADAKLASLADVTLSELMQVAVSTNGATRASTFGGGHE